MDDCSKSEHDAIEQFLGLHFPTGDDAKWQQTLLLKTTRVLRRRRRIKRLGTLALLAACYAAGLGTMYLWKPAPANSEEGFLVPREAAPAVAANQEIIAHPAKVAPPLDQDPDAPVVIVERAASASQEKRAVLYRRAGDRYLEEQGDVQSALRCYARYLEVGSENELSISTQDNWLLMALKRARQEEKNHAKDHS